MPNVPGIIEPEGRGAPPPAKNGGDPLRSARVRMRLLHVVLLVLFGIIALRLFQIQVIQGPKYREAAQRQYQSKIDLPATRGVLLDRNAVMLASNAMFVSYAADPQMAAEDAQSIATTFAQVFHKPRAYYLEKLRSDSRFVWLERQVSAEPAKQIRDKKLSGIVIREEPKRLYYHGEVAGQLVGATNIDNAGIAGMELQLNDELKGKNGWVVLQRDGHGRAFPSVEYPRVEPLPGDTVYLTIDVGLQAIAEKELEKGVEANHADRALAIILNPKTGEVLAMAQYPSIDPNNFGRYSADDQRLRAVTDMYEPGSVFKIVTTSAALEYNLVRPDRTFFAENGTYTVTYGRLSRKITDTHKEGYITFQQALEVSSNIVMAKVSDIIGSERLYKVARDYGFGITTNIEYPGEAGGILKKPKDWSSLTLNTIAYGYEVSVTPLQIAAAYAAVANGGTLMKPYLVKKVVDPSGAVVRETRPQPIRTVVSASTVATLREFFEGVVLRGTAKMAAIPNYRIAGKTGTSRKLVNGHYQEGTYTASFVGFVPADDPKIVCLVMMDNPRGTFYTGGTTSAPVFKGIIEQTMNALNWLAPAAPAPVIAQAAQTRKQTAQDEADDPPPRPRTGVIPDVRGRSLRQAVNVLMNEKLVPVVNGSGVVVRQSPEAGQAVRPGMKVMLTCQPRGAGMMPGN